MGNGVIRIVSCTRGQFVGTELYKSLSRFTHLPFFKVQVFENNTKGLSYCYNQAIESAGDETLVFVHDDMEITDHWWFKQIDVGLQQWDMVGVAGNAKRIHGQLSWAVADKTGRLINQQHWSGAVEQPGGWGLYSEPWKSVELIDGCLMAARARTFIENNIRFDEQFEFHHYDVDISRQFREKDLTIGVVGLSTVHHSQNKLDALWLKSCDQYLNKWGETNEESIDRHAVA